MSSPAHELLEKLQNTWGSMVVSGTLDGPSAGGHWILDVSLRGKRLAYVDWRPSWEGPTGPAGFGISDARHDAGLFEGPEQFTQDINEALDIVNGILSDPTGMRPHKVIVGAALYEFPDRKAVIKFLEARIGPEKLNVQLDAKSFGAKFIGRAPWDTGDYDCHKKLLEMFVDLDKQDIDP